MFFALIQLWLTETNKKTTDVQFNETFNRYIIETFNAQLCSKYDNTQGRI